MEKGIGKECGLIVLKVIKNTSLLLVPALWSLEWQPFLTLPISRVSLLLTTLSHVCVYWGIWGGGRVVS